MCRHLRQLVSWPYNPLSPTAIESIPPLLSSHSLFVTVSYFRRRCAPYRSPRLPDAFYNYHMIGYNTVPALLICLTLLTYNPTVYWRSICVLCLRLRNLVWLWKGHFISAFGHIDYNWSLWVFTAFIWFCTDSYFTPLWRQRVENFIVCFMLY